MDPYLFLGTIGPAVTAIAAAGFALITENGLSHTDVVVVTPEALEILSHKTLRLYCLLGALGGGVIGVGLTTTGPPREMAWKWTVGVVSGVLFTPVIIRYFGWHPGVDTLVATAGVVALTAWTALHNILPIIHRVLVKRVRRIVGDTSDPSITPRP